MGMFKREFDRFCEQKQSEELCEFITLLQSMRGPEIGLGFAMATHWRNSLSLERELMDPFYYIAANPQVCFEFSRMAKRLQQDGRKLEALGLGVWLHTLRAAQNEALYEPARAMWRELERGFPFARESATSYRRRTGRKLDADYSVLYPLGFSPQPLFPGAETKRQMTLAPESTAAAPYS